MLLRRLLRSFVLTIAVTSMVAFGATRTQPGTDRHRVGAVCNDGTISSATGRGACSHHGGVMCWKYSDGTCTKP